MTKNADLEEKILQLLRKAKKPVSIDYIRYNLGINWWTAYKAVAEIIFDEIKKHPEIHHFFPFLPLKSTKSLIIIPKASFWPSMQRGDIND